MSLRTSIGRVAAGARKWLALPLARQRFEAASILVLFAACFGVICLPGSVLPPDPALFRADLGNDFRVGHGWPWTFLERDASIAQAATVRELYLNESTVAPRRYLTAPAWTSWESWKFSGEHPRWRPWAIAADLAILALGLVLAYVASVRSVRRRGSTWSFSLKELFLLVTLLAIAFGWWRHGATQSTRDVALAKKFWRKSTCYTVRTYSGPEWLARLVGTLYLPSWRASCVVYHDMNDSTVEIDIPVQTKYESLKLSDIEDLEHIVVDRAQTSSALVMAALADKRLKSLGIPHIPEQIRELTCAIGSSELEFLWIMRPQRELAQFEAAASISSLRRLKMKVWEDAASGWLEPIAAMPRLDTLELDFIRDPALTSAQSPFLDLSPLRSCDSLRHLQLSRARIDASVVATFVEMSELSSLSLMKCKIAQAMLDRLHSERPDLQVVIR